MLSAAKTAQLGVHGQDINMSPGNAWLDIVKQAINLSAILPHAFP
jgi:hypothetical protein